jgi:hypothetical protein
LTEAVGDGSRRGEGEDMLLELDRDEQQLLLELVHARIDEIVQELAGPHTTGFAARCQGEKLTANRLLRHLHESQWDVTC